LIAVDSSAIVAILRTEPEEQRFVDAIIAAGATCLSAVSLQEASMVLAGRGGAEAAWIPLDDFIARARMEVVPHDRRLAEVAREAFLRFGKGRHPAGLNFGDCASYALAKSLNVPLLFKGTDFAQTDIVPALVAPA
jgi:ribonuclease VapC